MSGLKAWAIGIVTTAIVGALAAGLSAGFRALLRAAWLMVSRPLVRQIESPNKRRLRDEKRERLRPQFAKAIQAAEAVLQAAEAKQFEGKYNLQITNTAAANYMTAAYEAINGVRYTLSTEPEGDEIVKMFQRLDIEYRQFESMIFNQVNLLASHAMTEDYAKRIDEQFALIRKCAGDLKRKVQDTLKSLE